MAVLLGSYEVYYIEWESHFGRQRAHRFYASNDDVARKEFNEFPRRLARNGRRWRLVQHPDQDTVIEVAYSDDGQ